MSPRLGATLAVMTVGCFLAPLRGMASPTQAIAGRSGVVSMSGATAQASNLLERQQGNAMTKPVEFASRPSRKTAGPVRNVILTMTGVCVIAGCAGARTLPDGTAACSADAIEETKRFGIPRTSYFSVEVLGLVGSRSGVALIKEGPVELRVTNPVKAFVPDEIAKSPLCARHPPDHVVPRECTGATLVSDTALLYGEASFKGDRVQIRVHQLRDGGTIGPFCGVVAQRHTVALVGLEKNPREALKLLEIEEPPIGAAAVWSDAEVLIVTDDSQQPKP
jgi:hypothetical protein